MNTVSEIRRSSAANCQRTNSLGVAVRPGLTLPHQRRGTYPKPHHLLIASLACWAGVVAILIGVLI